MSANALASEGALGPLGTLVSLCCSLAASATIGFRHGCPLKGLDAPIRFKKFATALVGFVDAGATIKSWAEASGRPVQGHTARRSGALYYVREGVAVSDVTYLGRWRSDLVFQYAEEAMENRAVNLVTSPPAAGSKESLGLASTTPSSTAPASAALPPPTDSTLKPEPGTGSPLRSPGDLLKRSPKWVKAHGRSRVLHLVEDLTQQTSAAWRTRCGWTFARTSHFSLYISVPSGGTKCRKCRLSYSAQRGEPLQSAECAVSESSNR